MLPLIITQLSNHLAVADIDYQQQLRWRGEETSPSLQPVVHYKVVGSPDLDGRQPLKMCLQKCGSHTPQKWPIDDQLLTEHDRWGLCVVKALPPLHVISLLPGRKLCFISFLLNVKSWEAFLCMF